MARTKHITAADTQEVQTKSPKTTREYTTVGTARFIRKYDSNTKTKPLTKIILHMLDGHTYQIDCTKAKSENQAFMREKNLRLTMIKIGDDAVYDQAVIQEVTETEE